ncbi:RNA polymerase subunit sigma-70 [Labrys sp. WJW]|uniref:RNA polymerase sigma factor n=1 Tax=Labrys sp. WJW TaxID=1737983 RepID=UPI000837728D|nr:sigma-70 family RNA polymerase sigma factor [Labrys sp. WJW]OCC05488.1 RNA polymerase subunit sigma-70 [Labrys sp. WJW]
MAASLTSAFLLHRRSLMWSLMRIVRDPQIAEDLTQETYVRARQAIEAGPIDHIEAFLHQTARNLALDHARRNKMRAKFERHDASETEIANVAAEAPSAEAVVIQRERLKLLEETLARLPHRAQQVWRLSRVEKWPYPKIAEHLGVSANTVFNDLKLAMAHCHDALKRLDRH